MLLPRPETALSRLERFAPPTPALYRRALLRRPVSTSDVEPKRGDTAWGQGAEAARPCALTLQLLAQWRWPTAPSSLPCARISSVGVCPKEGRALLPSCRCPATPRAPAAWRDGWWPGSPCRRR